MYVCTYRTTNVCMHIPHYKCSQYAPQIGAWLYDMDLFNACFELKPHKHCTLYSTLHSVAVKQKKVVCCTEIALDSHCVWTTIQLTTPFPVIVMFQALNIFLIQHSLTFISINSISHLTNNFTKFTVGADITPITNSPYQPEQKDWSHNILYIHHYLNGYKWTVQ
jgi:hypothetical protein